MACLDANQILALVGGQLDAEALARADRHIDSCASCRQLIAWANRTEPGDCSSTARDPPGEDKAFPLPRGLSVGRYLLLGRLGSGGMGVVYSAYDPELDRRVAIKLIRADQGGAGTVAERQARLLREARAMARLQHPDVIAVHDAGAVGDQVFLAMEYVDGTTLREWLAASSRSWREVLAVFMRVGRGLAAAHAAGLVHRDFKPDNVLVGKDGRVRVTDFGLARLMSPAPVPLEGGPDSRSVPAGPVTRTGQLFGSPAYMAPEQMDGGATDARADVFSFCVALYEALYGDRPFRGRTVEELRQNIAAEDIPPPPKSFRVPERVRRALLRGLRAKPDERCGSMDELLRELERDPVGRRRLVVGSLLVAALVAAVGVPLWRSGTQHRLLCRGGEEQVAAVWSTARRDAVARAFRASGLPYVEPLLGSLGDGLDRWARSWSGMYRDACEATRVRGEQSGELLDLRMQCLSAHLIEARAVVDQLAAADRGLVEHADRVLAGLSPLDRCANSVQLRSQDPEPITPEGAAALARLREAHAVARTLALAQPETAGAALDPLLAEARKLAFRPLLSEVLITVANVVRYRGAREQAEASLQEAALQASLSGRHDLAGRALAGLIELNGYAGKLDEALRYSDLARAEIERGGDSGDDEASRLKGIGRVLALYGRFDAALPALRQAVALREKQGDRQDLSDALCALAEALGRAGQGREGLEVGRRCVSLVEQELGPMHPRVALALNMGLLFSLSALGETDEEEQVMRRVVEIEVRSLASDHWQLGLHLNNLGEALRKQGRCGEALAPLERAVAIAERRLPSSAVVVATMLGNLGACLVDLHRSAQARVQLERAKQLAGSVASAPPEVLSEVRFHLARALWDSGGSRSAARALAVEARRGLAALPELRRDLAEADRWLAEH